MSPSAVAGSAPGEGPPDHLKEQHVGPSEVAAELPEGAAGERRVRPPLGLVQALVVPGGQEAVEALGGVVVEVLRAYPGLEVQEPLGLPQLGEGIPDERVAVHHVDLLPGEDLQPAGQVLVVEAPLQRLVAGVHVALLDQELVQRLVGLVAGQAVVEDLGVVGHQPLRRVPDDEEQAHGRVHVPDPRGDLRGGEVAGGLLHRQLAGEGEGHLGPVPGQASEEVLLHVEVVHLTEGQKVEVVKMRTADG